MSRYSKEIAYGTRNRAIRKQWYEVNIWLKYIKMHSKLLLRLLFSLFLYNAFGIFTAGKQSIEGSKNELGYKKNERRKQIRSACLLGKMEASEVRPL